MKSKTNKILIFFTIGGIVIDQIIKLLINLFIKNSISIGFLGIEPQINTGMALGFNSGNVKNIIITIIILGIVLLFIKNQSDMLDGKTSLSLAMILSGGISNLIDRFFRNGVFDYLRIGKLFTCNIADILICIGWILLVIFVIKFSNKK